MQMTIDHQYNETDDHHILKELICVREWIYLQHPKKQVKLFFSIMFKNEIFWADCNLTGVIPN